MSVVYFVPAPPLKYVFYSACNNTKTCLGEGGEHNVLELDSMFICIVFDIAPRNICCHKGTSILALTYNATQFKKALKCSGAPVFGM